MKYAELIIDKAIKCIDLYYATGFQAPDAFTYIRTGGRKYLLMSDLELDRAKKVARVDSVLPLTKYLDAATKFTKDPTTLDAAMAFLKEKKIKNVLTPRSMSFVSVDRLRKMGFKVTAGPHPFYPARLVKSKKEVGHIIKSQKAVFSAMKLAEKMLREASIKKNALWLGGKPLTSERMRDAIGLHLYTNGYISPDGCIVAGGNEGTDPHNFGKGVLKPHESIIVDIFPMSMETLFFGDATRTFCKSKAPAKLKKMYEAVKKAQEDAISKVKDGVHGSKIHNEILSYFDSCGYHTGEANGRREGFFHGTGHGIGLELHEEPVRIKPNDFILKEGFVTSVEPGLYYWNVGGVRLEDLVLVEKKGCKILAGYPKKLEIL